MAEQRRISGIPTGVMAFIPWVVFGFASGFNHWRVATGGGLILCLVYLAVLVRRGISIKLIDWTTLTIFVIGAVLMFGVRSTMFPVYSAVLIWSCFALAAWSSVAGRPSIHHGLRPRKCSAGILGASGFHPAESADDAGLVRIDDGQHRLCGDRCHTSVATWPSRCSVLGCRRYCWFWDSSSTGASLPAILRDQVFRFPRQARRPRS